MRSKRGLGQYPLGLQRVYPKHLVELLDGMRLESIEAGEAVFAVDRHNGFKKSQRRKVLSDIAGAAMSMAYASVLKEHESFRTLDLKINFMPPAWKTPLKAVGRVIKSGRTIGLAECDIMNERNELIAHAIGTCLTLRSVGSEDKA